MVAGAPFPGCRTWEVVANAGSTWQLLAGRTAQDNDRLSLEVGRSDEAWLHAADVPGAHVVVRSLDSRDGGAVPPDVLSYAASFAAFYSKSKGSAKVKVHLTKCGKVSKQKGAPDGQVRLQGNFKTLVVKPLDPAHCRSVEKGADKEASNTSSRSRLPSARDFKRQQRARSYAEQNVERKRIREQKKLESAIQSLDDDIAALDEQAVDAAADWKKSQDIELQREELTSKQAALYEEWEALVDTDASVHDKLPSSATP